MNQNYTTLYIKNTKINYLTSTKKEKILKDIFFSLDKKLA